MRKLKIMKNLDRIENQLFIAREIALNEHEADVSDPRYEYRQRISTELWNMQAKINNLVDEIKSDVEKGGVR